MTITQTEHTARLKYTKQTELASIHRLITNVGTWEYWLTNVYSHVCIRSSHFLCDLKVKQLNFLESRHTNMSYKYIQSCRLTFGINIYFKLYAYCHQIKSFAVNWFKNRFKFILILNTRTHFHVAFIALIVSHIFYALHAWGGFLNSKLLNKINDFLRKTIVSVCLYDKNG